MTNTITCCGHSKCVVYVMHRITNKGTPGETFCRGRDHFYADSSVHMELDFLLKWLGSIHTPVGLLTISRTLFLQGWNKRSTLDHSFRLEFMDVRIMDPVLAVTVCVAGLWWHFQACCSSCSDPLPCDWVIIRFIFRGSHIHFTGHDFGFQVGARKKCWIISTEISSILGLPGFSWFSRKRYDHSFKAINLVICSDRILCL